MQLIDLFGFLAFFDWCTNLEIEDSGGLERHCQNPHRQAWRIGRLWSCVGIEWISLQHCQAKLTATWGLSSGVSSYVCLVTAVGVKVNLWSDARSSRIVVSFTESCLHPNIQRLKPTIPLKDMYYIYLYVYFCLYIYIDSPIYIYIHISVYIYIHRCHFSRYGPSYLGLHQVQAKVVEAQLHPIHSSCLGHPRIFPRPPSKRPWKSFPNVHPEVSTAKADFVPQ